MKINNRLFNDTIPPDIPLPPGKPPYPPTLPDDIIDGLEPPE